MSTEREQLSDRVEYRLDGELHRVDGPAVEWSNGDKEWWVMGKLHRVNGPAVEYANCGEEWYLNGKLHRVDGAAVECVDGYKEWCFQGKLHRVNGPAIERANGAKAWYLEGKQLQRTAHRQLIYERYRTIYSFAYEFPGGMDAVIKNRMFRFAGMGL